MLANPQGFDLFFCKIGFFFLFNPAPQKSPSSPREKKPTNNNPVKGSEPDFLGLPSGFYQKQQDPVEIEIIQCQNLS